MEALIAHKPAQLPLAQRVKNTEDGVRLDPGDGFWRTAQSKGSYRLFNADVETGNVVFLGSSAAGLYDLHPTPLQTAMSGTEVQVQLVEQMLAMKAVN